MQDKYNNNFLQNSLTNKYIWNTMFTMRYTYKHFQKLYPNDDACLEKVFQDRFGHVKFCPYCAAETKFYRVKKRQCYACQWCGYQLHPLADTIFRKSHIPLTDWFYAIYQFSTSKNGVAAKKIERDLGVTYQTAWRMCKQIRLLMQQDTEQLTGVVEADETYIGGRRKLAHRFDNKLPVIGITEKGGSSKAIVAHEGATSTAALSFLRSSIKAGSTIHTDESRIYSRVKREFIHEFVNHSKEQYVKDGVHTNTIEGFWGQLKRSISGTHHAVSPKYLQSYVNQFVFLYNLRGAAVCPVLLELASKPV